MATGDERGLVERDVIRHPERTQYRAGQRRGHYESFFLRANHPSGRTRSGSATPSSAPTGRPDAALGELWGVYFDGESGGHVAVKQEVP